MILWYIIHTTNFKTNFWLHAAGPMILIDICMYSIRDCCVDIIIINDHLFVIENVYGSALFLSLRFYSTALRLCPDGA